jgi:hypothetical protein
MFLACAVIGNLYRQKVGEPRDLIKVFQQIPPRYNSIMYLKPLNLSKILQ